MHKMKIFFLIIFLVGLLTFFKNVNAQALTTNKQNYSPGETVYITGTNFSLDVDASLQINDPNDIVKFVYQTVTDTNGDFSSTYVIPSKGTIGTYIIYASSPNEFAQVTFNILGAIITTTSTTTTSSTITTTIPRNTETKLCLNSTEGNFYYLNNTYANFTVWVNISGRVYLDTNITGWTTKSGNSPFTQIVLLNATKNNTYYNITGYFPGNATHDPSSQTHYAIVYVTTTTTTTVQTTTTIGGDGGKTTTTKPTTTTKSTTTSTIMLTTTTIPTTTIITTPTTIPPKKEMPKPLLMLGIGILIILIVAALVIVIKSIHWGTEEKILIVLMIATVLISLLISSLSVQERKRMKGLSIWDWFTKLWEWIVPPPEVAIVYPFKVSGQILDSNHNPTVFVFPGQKYYVSTNITNVGEETKSARFIVQIKDSSGQVIEDISSSSLQLDPGQTKKLEVNYTAPDVIGDYTAQIFVWTDWASRRGFALAPSLNLSFTVSEIKKEHILNYLNYSFYSYIQKGYAFDLTWVIDSYDILGINPPNRAQAIEFLNSIQSDEGTWYNGSGHYVPITAQILMLYNRSGVKPPKSLDSFFSTVDTWEEVNAHVNTYDKGNYWGGLWGYVNCYVVYKGEAPPWTNEFLNEANTKFDTWAYDNHQRTHLIGNLLQLGQPIPRIDDVVSITLQQQNLTDGSWDSNEAETIFSIQVLRYIRNQTNVDKNLIDSAINRGLEYVRKCYKTVDYQGKTYAGFAENPSGQYPSPRATAEGIWALLNPQSDIWSRWFVNKTNLLQDEIGHIDNSLEYLRSKGLGIHDMAEYVISKSFLGAQIPNKQQIIDYFDNNQGADGSWKDVWTTMFTTYRVLLAYYILNATPKHSLDSFFSNYDTWTEAKNYMINEAKTDLRDIYHITFAWSIYYRTYPTWLNDFFTEAEKDLTWTNGTDAHKRMHILFNYVIARKAFPNLDGIIDETLREQSPDGHWDYPPRQIYWNGMQLGLLQQILKLYPTYRTIEIQNSIDKSRQWVYNSYNTQVLDNKTYGRFGNSTYIEDSLLTGIMAAGINGLMNINVDMTFEDLVRLISLKYEQLLCTGAKYNPNIPEVQGTGWFPYGLKPETEIDEDFKHAKNLGLNVIRFFVLYDVPEKYSPPLNISPIDNRVISYMDLIISKAKKYDLKLMPTLLTDTVTTTPMLNYHIDYLKKWVEGIITKYKDEPIIYAWDVINEPLIENPDHLSKALTLINYAKTLDPDTPITSGEMIVRDDVRKAVDIISLHWYPYYLLNNNQSPYQSLINTINAAKQYNKPIILQEFDMATAPPYSERGQECFLFKTLDIVKSSGIKGYIYLNLKDYPTSQFIDIPGASRKSGLIRSDYSYKPAVSAINPTYKATISLTTTITITKTTSTTTTTITATTTTTIPTFRPLLSLSNDESTLYDVVDGKLYFAYFGYDPPSGLVKLNTSTNEATLIGQDTVYRWTAWNGFYDANDKKLWFAGEYYDPASSGQPPKGTIFQYDLFSNVAKFVRHPSALEAWGIISYPPYLAYGQIWNNTMYGIPKSTWTNVSTWIKKEVPYSGAIDFGYWKGKLYGIAIDSGGKIKIFDTVTLGEVSSFTDLFPSGGGDVSFTADKVLVITVDKYGRVWLHESDDLITWRHTSLNIPFPSSLNTSQLYHLSLKLLSGKLIVFKSIGTWKKGSTDGNTEIYVYDNNEIRRVGSLKGFVHTKTIVYNNILYLATSYPNYIYKIPVSELGI